ARNPLWNATCRCTHFRVLTARTQQGSGFGTHDRFFPNEVRQYIEKVFRKNTGVVTWNRNIVELAAEHPLIFARRRMGSLPDTRKVRLPIGSRWCFGGQVRRAVTVPRRSGRRIVQPLRLGGYGNA